MRCLLTAAAAAAAMVGAAAGAGVSAAQAAASVPPTAVVRPLVAGGQQAFEATIESRREAQVAAQVTGAVVEVVVHAGQRVAAGQVLLRIDARGAAQGAAAQDAQVAAAQAQAVLAGAELARQRQLQVQGFISPAALQRAEAAQRAARAQLTAAQAQAGLARTQSALHVLRAPFAGVVAALPVMLGDMVLPGRPLLTLVDPTALRASAAVPASLLGTAGLAPEAVAVELGDGRIRPLQVQVLPTVDARSLTRTVQANLPAQAGGVPGQFARLWLPVAVDAAGPAPRLGVPLQAVVRRGELTGVYVQPPQGAPRLRQVRLGRTLGADVEVLAGLSAGERVHIDPQRLRLP